MNISPISINNYNNNYKTNFTSKISLSSDELEGLIKTHSIAEISEITGYTKSYISHLLNYYGLKTPQTEKRKALEDCIETLLINGNTINEISETHNLPQHVVKYAAIKVLGKDRYNSLIKQIKLNRANEIPKAKNKTKRKLFDEIISNILAKMKQGTPFVIASKEAGIHPSTISRYINPKDLEEARNCALSAKQKTIRNLVKEGYSIRQIAQELNTNTSKIYYTMGEEYRSQWKKEKKQYQLKHLLSYQLEGLTNNQIAEKMNISIDTVKRLLKMQRKQ